MKDRNYYLKKSNILTAILICIVVAAFILFPQAELISKVYFALIAFMIGSIFTMIAFFADKQALKLSLTKENKENREQFRRQMARWEKQLKSFDKGDCK